MEKLLGNVGLGKFGKGIDWFFDTSTISGAKAWRLQVKYIIILLPPQVECVFAKL